MKGPGPAGENRKLNWGVPCNPSRVMELAARSDHRLSASDLQKKEEKKLQVPSRVIYGLDKENDPKQHSPLFIFNHFERTRKRLTPQALLKLTFSRI